jgi:ABC-type Co2+ transport system permease subunit
LSTQSTERLHGRTVRQVSLQEKIEMKKLISVVAVLFCVASAARADNSRRSSSMSGGTGHEKLLLSVDADFALPIGTYADGNGVGGSVLLVGEYPLMDVLSATARIGFQYHADKSNTFAGVNVDSHAHAIPVLVGAKYYLMPGHEGLFGAMELGAFELLASASSGGTSASNNEVKFGGGAGIGWAMKQWNARVNVHSQDFGHFGDMIMVSAGVGYQFMGF